MDENCTKKIQFHTENPEQAKRELAWLWKHMKRNRARIAAVGLLGLAGTALSLASGVASKYAIDAVAARNFQTLWISAAMMAVLVLGSLGLQSVSARVSAAAHIRVRSQLQHTAVARILGASWQALEQYRSGDLLSRLNSDVAAVSEGIVGLLPGLVTACLKFLGALVIIMYFDPGMALIALASAPVTLLLSRGLLGRLRRHDREMKELTGRVMSFQEDSLRNLTSIKAFGSAGAYENELLRQQEAYQQAYLSYHSFRTGMSACLSLAGMLVTAICLGWGVYQLWAGRITYGSLILFLQLASTLRGAFSSLVSLAQQTVSIATSAGRVMVAEDLPAENTEVPPGFSEEQELALELKQVRFRYQNGNPVLDAFDFYARPGDIIAVTGASGEGKTTLLRLLLGLVEPCEGEMSLLGGSGSRYPISAGTRGAFSYVPQGNSVFSGTIAQNLRITAPDASDEELEFALKTACAWDFVGQLPGGLNHELLDGGRGISEGQAQRLAIARALLRKAPILLLDEATSALDEATERQFLENLRQSGLMRTCILVTHRPACAEVCTRAYEIDQGRVTEAEYGA